MRHILIYALLTVSIGTTVAQNKKVELWSVEELLSFIETELDGSKLTVINFWATWCAPCIKEMPYFENLNISHQNTVEVLFVSLDFANELEKKVIPILKRKDIKSKVVLLNDQNYNEWIGKVNDSWSGAIPATLFITRQGKQFFFEKDFAQEELIETINKIELVN